MPTARHKRMNAPADIYIRKFVNNQDAALDVTVVNPLQLALVDRAATTAGHALDYARRRKLNQSYEACRQEGIAFIPLPVETLGAWHPQAVDTIKRIASAAAKETHKDIAESTKHFFQRLSVLLVKDNSALFLSRKPISYSASMLGD